ncbi:DUF551 domain-containing protein [Escherichia coli]|nr:DUF551 domain-containing protein [Escherichia coli]
MRCAELYNWRCSFPVNRLRTSAPIAELEKSEEQLIIEQATHWMPLPEPPQESKSE